jgi:hypothetical protein
MDHSAKKVLILAVPKLRAERKLSRSKYTFSQKHVARSSSAPPYGESGRPQRTLIKFALLNPTRRGLVELPPHPSEHPVDLILFADSKKR